MQRLSPSRTVVTSFNPKTSPSSSTSSLNNTIINNHNDYYDDGDWVLCVAAQPGTLACALSNGQVQLYDAQTMHLVNTYERDDNSLVTELTMDTFREHVLAATANDGSLTLYDIRQRQQQTTTSAGAGDTTVATMEWKNMLRPDEEALTLSMGFDGNIAAVGSSKGKIHFFDVRSNQGILGSYTQAHTDEVTRVRFQSSTTGVGGGSGGATYTTTSTLVSASEDGLACVFDTSQPTEESAVTNILPVQAPIREVGFFGPSMDGIYCLTGSESMQLYHKDESMCRKDFGLEFRNHLNQQLAHNNNANNNSLQAATMGNRAPFTLAPMKYLVDCHWDVAQQELLLLTGSASGDAALFQVGNQGVTPRHYLHGGHRGVIRAWQHSSSNSSSGHNNGTFLTVGEDARMCEWSRTPSAAGGANGISQEACSMMVGSSPPIVVPSSRKRSGGPMQQGVVGGKFRRPRSRLTASPY